MIIKSRKLALMAALSVLTGAAFAAGNIQGKRFGDWGGQCETSPQNQQVCYLQQVLSEKDKKTPIMVTVIGYGQGKQFPTAIFELPKGADLKQGVQLKIDKYKAVGFSGACDQNGCRAGFTLDNPLTQQFSKGQQALLAYRPAPGKEPVILPISLKGLAAGLQAIK